jgi:hypothetical protein
VLRAYLRRRGALALHQNRIRALVEIHGRGASLSRRAHGSQGACAAGPCAPSSGDPTLRGRDGGPDRA